MIELEKIKGDINLKLRSILFFSVISILSVVFGLSILENKMPGVNLKVNTTKSKLVNSAGAYSKEFGFDNYNFDYVVNTDDYYVEYTRLKLNGVESINENIGKYSIYPSSWQFRFFKEDDLKELNLILDMDANKIGFSIKIPDDFEAEDLGESKSRSIADLYFQDWYKKGIYKEVENSKEKKLHHTVYNFVYESDFSLGEAKHRYSVKVIGDKVVSVMPLIKIPKMFSKEYSDIRTKNIITFSLGYIFHIIVSLIAIVVFIYYLSKKKISLLFTVKVLSIFLIGYILMSISNLKNIVFNFYSTSSSLMTFYLQQLVRSISSNLVYLGFFGILIAAAIALDEKAFPNHVNFRQLFSKKFLASKNYLVMVLKGYWIGSINILVAASFYLLASKIGWNPGINLPFNSFNEYFPFTTSSIISLQAGFLEEFFFRGIVIAIAYILSKRYGKIALYLGIIAQAVGFGAAHANYASIPFYFRVVELFLPSLLIFGLSYWMYGLFVGAISHFFFDFILFCYPVVENINYFGYLNVAILGIIGLFPIFIHVLFRYALNVTPEVILNRDAESENCKISPISFNPNAGKNVSSFVILVFSVLLFYNIKSNPKIDKDLIKCSAREFLAEKDFYTENLFVNFEKRCDRLTEALLDGDSNISYENAQNEGLIGNVAYASSKDRKNMISHIVKLKTDGSIIGYESHFDESIEMPSLSKEEAVDVAKKEIKSFYNQDNLKEIGVKLISRPKRTDWDIVFEVTENIRIKVLIAGDRVVTLDKHLYFSERSLKLTNKNWNYIDLIKSVSTLVVSLVVILFIAFGIFNFNSSFIREGVKYSILAFIAFLLSQFNQFSLTLILLKMSILLEHELLGTHGGLTRPTF